MAKTSYGLKAIRVSAIRLSSITYCSLPSIVAVAAAIAAAAMPETFAQRGNVTLGNDAITEETPNITVGKNGIVRPLAATERIQEACSLRRGIAPQGHIHDAVY